MNKLLALYNPRHSLKPRSMRQFRIEDLEGIQEDGQEIFVQYWEHAVFEKFGATVRAQDDSVIFCCGAFCVVPGVVDAWFIPGPSLKSYRRETYLDTERIIRWWSVDLKVRRAQAVLKESMTVGRHFAERMGFNIEGKMLNMFKDGNGIMYGRVF